MGKGLENVRRLYLDGIAGGDARASVEKYTGHRYTQHSTGVANGVEGFLAFFEPFLERNPKREIEILRIFEDGPWVFCSAYQSLNDGADLWVTTDLFHTDPAGQILEHWDAIAAYVDETKSGNDMVGGACEIDPTSDREANKTIVLEYTKQVVQGLDYNEIDKFIAENLIQHAPTIGAGRAGLRDWLSGATSGRYEMLFKLVGQGDFVATYGKRHADGRDIAVFDIYRVESGIIAEHWMNEEEIGARETWFNSGKF